MTAGEKALNQVLNSAQKLANLDSTNPNCKLILNLCDELKDLAQSLIHLRRNGQVSRVVCIDIFFCLSSTPSRYPYYLYVVSSCNHYVRIYVI
ncbi:unnamed protein product [Trichobilharzia regenti]|nr:unnamed protein product [Trichobilharzia regenti]